MRRIDGRVSDTAQCVTIGLTMKTSATHQESPWDVTRLTRPFSRRALRRPNLAYFMWRFVANGIRTGGALLTRRSQADTSAIERDLQRDGIISGHSDRFLTPAGQQALKQATERILQKSRTPDVEHSISGTGDRAKRKKEFLVHLASYPEGIAADDPLLRVALDRKLLEVVSGYFGFWPCLYSIGAWLNYPTDTAPELSQLWHRDPEDLKTLKVFIYLVDVDEQCGPFCYVPGSQPFGANKAAVRKLEQKQRVPDEIMARMFPPESWRICTGPASTMILADTVGYHRGGKPAPGHRRILITFTFTSGTPITERKLRVRDRPAWATAAVQRFAVGPLLSASADPAGKKRQ
jgi:hypothetical protein